MKRTVKTKSGPKITTANMDRETGSGFSNDVQRMIEREATFWSRRIPEAWADLSDLLQEGYTVALTVGESRGLTFLTRSLRNRYKDVQKTAYTRVKFRRALEAYMSMSTVRPPSPERVLLAREGLRSARRAGLNPRFSGPNPREVR